MTHPLEGARVVHQDSYRTRTGTVKCVRTWQRKQSWHHKEWACLPEYGERAYVVWDSSHVPSWVETRNLEVIDPDFIDVPVRLKRTGQLVQVRPEAMDAALRRVSDDDLRDVPMLRPDDDEPRQLRARDV